MLRLLNYASLRRTRGIETNGIETNGIETNESRYRGKQPMGDLLTAQVVPGTSGAVTPAFLSPMRADGSPATALEPQSPPQLFNAKEPMTLFEAETWLGYPLHSARRVECHPGLHFETAFGPASEERRRCREYRLRRRDAVG